MNECYIHMHTNLPLDIIMTVMQHTYILDIVFIMNVTTGVDNVNV